MGDRPSLRLSPIPPVASQRKEQTMRTQTSPRFLIKFPQGALATLRERVLADSEHEQFAVLLARTRQVGGSTILTVVDLLFPAQADYQQQSGAFLRIRKAFIHQVLVELTTRCRSEEHTSELQSHSDLVC